MGIPSIDIPNLGSLKKRYAELNELVLNNDNFDSWLARWSEIEKMVCEARNILQFQRYANTNDEVVAAQQADYASTVTPFVAEENAKLRRKYFAFEHRPVGKLAEVDKGFEADDLLHSPTNAALETQIVAAASKFSEIKAQITVPLETESVSVGQAYLKMTVSDRAKQEKVWRTIKQAETIVAEDLDSLYLELVNLRKTVAKGAGFANFRDFRWLELRRFGYTPDTCHTFTQALAEQLPPYLELVRTFRRDQIGVLELRPWDAVTSVFPNAHNAKTITINETLDLTREILASLDERLAVEYDSLRSAGRFDLEPRAGKASIMVAEYFPVSETSYINMILNGHFADTKMFFHEVAHAVHFQVARNNSLIWQQPNSIEFTEFFAHFMELYALKMISTRFKDKVDEDLREIKFIYLDSILNQLAFCVTLDRLQHFVYAEHTGELTAQEFKDKYLEIAEPLGIGYNWQGLHEERALNRHFQHLYSHPFYFIEYGFAWVQALRMLKLLEQNPQQFENLFRSLQLGGSIGTKELFEAAGIPFQFDEQSVHEAMQSITSLFSDVMSFSFSPN